MEIKSLSPAIVWKYFHEITQVPRPSKKEDRIKAYLIDFAQKNKIEYKQDKIGNIVMTKPATPGFENRPTVLFQSHMDMVCEKNADTTFDFENDPIQTYVDGDWVKAKGTTLGGDNGIGMAYQLALMASTDLQHGKIEALFTVDEETGLTGASNLEPGMFTASRLINIDSDFLGEIFIGCAGGIDTLGHFPLTQTSAPSDHFFFRFTVKGLKGGHSGCDIHLGLGNANKLLARFLDHLHEQYGLVLSHIDGGNLRNAIAREATCVAGVPSQYKENVRVDLNHFIADVEGEIADVEPNIQFLLESETAPESVFTADLTKRLLNTVLALPHGVMGMSRAMDNLVETSTNMASVKMKNNEVIVTTSQRSSTNSLKREIATTVKSIFELAGAKVEQSDGYPGWKPNPNSKLLQVAKTNYEQLFGSTPAIKAIHAGLECGLFLEKYPGLDMISIGPTMIGIHSPDEKLNIPAVAAIWDYLIAILKDENL